MVSLDVSVSVFSIFILDESFVDSIVTSATVSSKVSGAFFSTTFSYTGSGDPLLVSSASPCAKRHLSPYLHAPFSLKFLQLSYFLRITPEVDVEEDVDTAA
jgi:hypothetical protein